MCAVSSCTLWLFPGEGLSVPCALWGRGVWVPAAGVQSVTGLPEQERPEGEPCAMGVGLWVTGPCVSTVRAATLEHLCASTWRVQMGYSKCQPLGWHQQSEIPVPAVPALRMELHCEQVGWPGSHTQSVSSTPVSCSAPALGKAVGAGWLWVPVWVESVGNSCSVHML